MAFMDKNDVITTVGGFVTSSEIGTTSPQWSKEISPIRRFTYMYVAIHIHICICLH